MKFSLEPLKSILQVFYALFANDKQKFIWKDEKNCGYSSFVKWKNSLLFLIIID